jgi:trehalose-6-phosphatase
MSTPEAKIKTFISSYMKREFPNAWKYCPAGGFYGKAGLPDFLYLIDGILVGIEAKAEGGVPTTLQLITLKKMRDCGAIVAIVTGKDLDKMEKIKNVILLRLSVATR